jgi:hypothetical protein
VEVLHGHLAGATAAACTKGAALRLAPAPRQKVDLARVLVVFAFARNVLELQKKVDCHCYLL